MISKRKGKLILQNLQESIIWQKLALWKLLLQEQVLEYKETMERLKLSSPVIKGMEEKNLISVERERMYRTPVPKDIQKGYEYQLFERTAGCCR